jgi:large subunit ribosomal protein L21
MIRKDIERYPFYLLLNAKNMAKIAVIKTGGKQYKVTEGQVLKIEKLIDKQVNDKISFETLLIADEDGKTVEVGQPSLGEKVSAEIVRLGKADKVTVVKFKSKVRYTRTNGHRQPFAEVKITSIA